MLLSAPWRGTVPRATSPEIIGPQGSSTWSTGTPTDITLWTDEEDLAMCEPHRGLTEGGETPEGCPAGSGLRFPLTRAPASTGGLERFRVVVIGGGLTGLAAGYELNQQGVYFVILERGSRLGHDWRPRWDAVRAFTPARFYGLPGLPFRGQEESYVTADQMSEYLEQYAERFDLPVRFGIDVLGVTPDERGQLVVEWEHGRLLAGQVIVATDLLAVHRRTTHDRDRRTIPLRVGEYRTLTQLAQAEVVVVVAEVR